MNADDRFMDLLLERVLGGVEAPAFVVDPDAPPRVRRVGATRTSTRRAWLTAAALLLLGIGAAAFLGGKPTEPETPQGMVLLAGTELSWVGRAVQVDQGVALFDEDAPPVVFEDGTLRAVGGRVLVSAGGVPAGAALERMSAWLTSRGGLAAPRIAALAEPGQWFAGRGMAFALLSGGVVVSGNTDLAWAGRTWTRKQGDAPLRVALVANADTVGRLGRHNHAVKVARIDAEGGFARELGRTKTLTHIDLSGCLEVDDAAMRHLGRLEDLRVLDVSHTRVGNRGLAWLSGAASLEALGLRGLTGVTPEGLVLLAETHAHALTRLDLRGGVPLDAAAVKAIAPCTKLVHLAVTMRGTPTAEDLAPLASLERLAELVIELEGDGAPTPDALRSLLTMLPPKCEIRVAPVGTAR